MKNILFIGAGRSAGTAIDYLLQHAEASGWTLTLADASLAAAEHKLNAHPQGKAIQLDITAADKRREAIQQADVVVSLLPANLHALVAQDCLEESKHLITASYVAPAIRAMHEAVLAKGLVFMNEIGLDPGIDHLSAIEKIHQIQAEGGKITAFRSYCGGLVAPESDNNPWHYKFSWAPRNVILAGQGTAQYRLDGANKYIPYQQLFAHSERLYIPELGAFDAYANRDSLGYDEPYNLQDTPTILRATLRHASYCKAWDAFVKLGLTDDTHCLPDSANLTYSQLLLAFLPEKVLPNGNLRERTAAFLGLAPDDMVLDQLAWLELFNSNEKINLPNATAAQALQQLLERKWVMSTEDKDWVVMHHIFDYTKTGQNYRLTSTLSVIGESQEHTAMAKLVGLPLAIFVKLLMAGQVTERGVLIPLTPALYHPILKELETYGVVFTDRITAL